MTKKINTLNAVKSYYSEKISRHGASPEGVDWNGVDSQNIRFEQLSKILPTDLTQAFSLNDLGCGYAALVDFLKQSRPNFHYTGYDLSPEMIEHGIDRNNQYDEVKFYCSDRLTEEADFSIASGIFSVKLDEDDGIWLDHIKSVLENLNDLSVKGFAFNCLTKYSDAEKMRPHLYYADPSEIFDYCKRNYSRNVALLHDYDLYEFTILVRK